MESTKPSSNSAENGNKSKPLLATGCVEERKTIIDYFNIFRIQYGAYYHAFDYACQICPNESTFFQTGFDLCELVIKAPGTRATSAQYAAAGAMVFNQLAGNKYSAKSSGEDWTKANERKKQIQDFGTKIKIVENKYREGLIRLGVKSESERTIVKQLGNKDVFIDEDVYKKRLSELKTTRIVIAVFFGFLGIGGVFDENASFSSVFGLLIFSCLTGLSIYGLYYYNVFNAKCNNQLGMSFIKAKKLMRNK